ncbi:hypothetical protein RclHR1_02010016 [Rhizophagus clarus]|uniref:Uncharacterized protein n=1 Tax=Rhizophagus clarus TaxID=94130 RepID=A0A2Z6R385_9GLOM|nr:hypothetical protein RclHR1_02010016 [Rhizophagus clarus]GET03268.1 hypothetical protein RCL_jg8451.t1 [Rhizophagus clarus]
MKSSGSDSLELTIDQMKRKYYYGKKICLVLLIDHITRAIGSEQRGKRTSCIEEQAVPLSTTQVNDKSGNTLNKNLKLEQMSEISDRKFTIS